MQLSDRVGGLIEASEFVAGGGATSVSASAAATRTMWSLGRAATKGLWLVLLAKR